MAIIDLSVTVSVADQNRVLASWQSEANADLNGTASPAQVQTYVKKAIRKMLSDRVIAFEYAAATAAVAQPATPSIT